MENLYFAIGNRNMLVANDDCQLNAKDLEIISGLSKPLDTFTEERNGISVINVSEDFVHANYKWVPIRSQFAAMGYDDCFQLSRAKALIEWRKSTKFCGSCGTALEESKTETARVCPKCGNIIFPRINPCIIVLVSKGDKILLARHAQRNQDIYACLAGFIEAGETVEQAVEREIMEETGIRVKNIRYYASQSWPFPAQLMMGFTAEYESGELKLQEEEIADAGWFSRDNSPASPQPGSVAYRLIHQC